MRDLIDDYLSDIKHFLDTGQYEKAKMDFEALLEYAIERNEMIEASSLLED